MAWIRATLRTTGTLITASIYNTDLIDPQNYTYDNALGSEYAVTWGADSSAPSKGNGSLVGRVWRLGSNVVGMDIRLVGGTTTNFGAGAWIFSIPVAANLAAANRLVGSLHNTGVEIRLAIGYIPSSTSLRVTAEGVAGIGITATAPFTWGSSDEMNISGVYLSA